MKRSPRRPTKNGLVAGAFGGSAEVINTYAAMRLPFMAAAVDVDC